MFGSPPSQQEALRLHQRLLEGDAAATADLAAAYLAHLAAWLESTNRGIDPDLCSDAAADAVLALMRNPRSYDPGYLSLEAYLRMSARGDLLNALHKVQKDRETTIPLKCVELSPEAGKYLGRGDDPSLPLQIAEQLRETERAVPASVREGLTEVELRVLDLMLTKERRTAAYADILGIAHLPRKEQAEQSSG
jgi:hypothetical protein